jgi:hypothetical protein
VLVCTCSQRSWARISRKVNKASFVSCLLVRWSRLIFSFIFFTIYYSISVLPKRIIIRKPGTLWEECKKESVMVRRQELTIYKEEKGRALNKWWYLESVISLAIWWKWRTNWIFSWKSPNVKCHKGNFVRLGERSSKHQTDFTMIFLLSCNMNICKEIFQNLTKQLIS